jgi:hypothetical protein
MGQQLHWNLCLLHNQEEWEDREANSTTSHQGRQADLEGGEHRAIELGIGSEV